MLRTNNNMLLFMGKLMGLNKLQMGTYRKQEKICAICHDLPYVETRVIYDGFGRL
jgi:hypothetical protein